MARTIKKIILSTPIEFIRHIHTVLLRNTRAERDTDMSMISIVTRAKNLIEKKGFIVSTSEKEDN